MNTAESYINNIPKFATKTELKNTELLLGELGVNIDKMRIIHVAGTNGKGSVCSYISNILVEAGLKTGLFISPHLVKINERVQINNIPVNDEIFMDAFYKVKQVAENMEKKGGKHPAYFEFLFGMAMLIFSKQNVDIVVLETGLGGRLDSTNIVKKPLMTIITSVSKDHCHILGDTVEEIAREKAGIIKKNVPLVFFGEDKRVREVLIDTAKKMNSPYEYITSENVSGVEKNGKNIDFLLSDKYYNNELISVGSNAYYQIWNASLAATAMAWLANEYNDTIFNGRLSMGVIKNGIKKAFWEGRMEEITPGVIVDGAHNEDGIRVFLETAVRMKDRHQILMFSAVADKDYVSMIKEIVESGAFDEYIVCTVEYTNRAMPANVFLDTFKKFTDKPVFLRETAKEALDCALERKGENARLFIAGSLYLVGEIKRMFLKENK